MSDYLTIADLKRLYLVTFDARIKWRNILLILDIPSDTIDSIGRDCWEDVVKALSSPIVGEVHIAKTIEKDHPSASNPKLQGKYQWHIIT